MRYIVCLVFGLYSFQVAAQLRPAQPNDNTIYIISKDSGDTLFAEVGKRLAKAGFPLTTTSKEFGQIATGEKIVTDYHYSYYVIVLIERNKAIIKPIITNDLVLGTHRWYYEKRKTSVNYKLTEHLLSVLHGVGEVSFGKEPE